MQHANDFLDIVNRFRPQVKELNVQQVHDKFANEEQFIFIDVREDSEWAKARLPHAIHVGRGVMERDINAIVPDKNTEIVLYCGGGFRSVLAAYNLQLMGYSNVHSMDGGFRDWNEQGYLVDHSPLYQHSPL
jgi:rhodanese-related sulfurtransferase